MRGGLVVAPSGPNLADLDRMPAYQRSLTQADLVVLDSGYLVLCWKRARGRWLQRLSGLTLLATLLENDAFRAGAHDQLWVMPDEAASRSNREYLVGCGISLSPEQCYVAPHYPGDDICDPVLLTRIQEQRPTAVIINVAGGKQEVLGAWLKSKLDYRPMIVCTGAAIAFLSGQQASIPSWADRLFLGWLMRIFSNPRFYGERYWKARRLWRLVKRYGEQAPPPLGQS